MGSGVSEVAGTPGVGTPSGPRGPRWDAGTPGPEMGLLYMFWRHQCVGNSMPAPCLAEESQD